MFVGGKEGRERKNEGKKGNSINFYSKFGSVFRVKSVFVYCFLVNIKYKRKICRKCMGFRYF